MDLDESTQQSDPETVNTGKKKNCTDEKEEAILTRRAGTMWSIIFFENASSVWTT